MENWADEGSKQFTFNYTAITEALKGFVKVLCLVQRNKDDKEADAGNTNHTYIQEFFFSNLTKMNFLQHYVVSYDLKDNLIIRELHNTSHVSPQVKWGPSKFYLLKDYAKIPLSIVLEHQADTNMYCLKHDQQRRNWIYALAFNSMTIKRHDCVIPTYN